MAYDDDDLFEEEFDFVDEDDLADDASEPIVDEEPEPKRKKSAAPRAKRPAKRAKKKAAKIPRARSQDAEDKPAGGQDSRNEAEVQEAEAADEAKDDDAIAAPSEVSAEREGPPADQVVHIYEYGQLLRTIPRKFTEAEATAFAEEYSRTGKPYGRLAIPASQDDAPAKSFADAAK
ncbi:MAG: hypothetical protein AAF961_17160, partial [Planctomycetota bacterium]